MRKTKVITIETDNRDKGKSFLIKEMSAHKAEQWSAEALVAIFSGNVPADILQVSQTSNTAALATAMEYLLKGLSWKSIKPLYNSLLSCVSFIPEKENKANPVNVIPLTETNIENFIEEVPTLLKLRLAALEINLGFLGEGAGLFSHLMSANTPQD